MPFFVGIQLTLKPDAIRSKSKGQRECKEWKGRTERTTYGKFKSTLSMIEFRITKVKCYKKIYHFNSSTIRKNK